jgi:hypothetical protein
MFSLKSLLYTVVLVISILVFVYFYIRKKSEFGYFDVVLIGSLLWVCGFVFTVNFGSIIFMIMEYGRRLINYLLKYF